MLGDVRWPKHSTATRWIETAGSYQWRSLRLVVHERSQASTASTLRWESGESGRSSLRKIWVKWRPSDRRGSPHGSDRSPAVS
jgi:hypothetical protein